MIIKNKSDVERVLSHRGIDYHLFPGATADITASKGEAEALASIFEVSGEPEAKEQLLLNAPESRGRKNEDNK